MNKSIAESRVAIYQQGIILITLLSFTFIIALLVLASMDMALLMSKENQNFLAQQEVFQAAEAGLQQAEQALMNDTLKKCSYSQLMLKEAIEHDQRWWQTQCLGEFTGGRLNYLIGQYPVKQCQWLEDQGLRVIKLHSVISRAVSEDENITVILQSTFAKASDEACAQPSLNRVSIGRLSWRQLK